MTAPTNPLLDTLSLPRFADLAPDQIAPALDEAIARHEAMVEALTTARPTDFAGAWLPYERANTEIGAIWSAVSHLHGVADTPELRAAYAEGQKRLVENDMKVGQNRDLYEVFVALSVSPAFASLPEADRVAVEHAIRDFTLSGVALEPEARDRFSAISVELSGLSNEFGSAVLDATDAWSELLTDEADLAGISDADKAMFADAAKAKGQAGWLITLQQPSVRDRKSVV
jgi:oligopeptidase A